MTNLELSAQSSSIINGWIARDISNISNLPPIGLAGQSAIIHNNKLFVLGGSNFPDAMPWEGGQKKYFDQLRIYNLGNKIEEFKQPISAKYPHPIAYATAILYNNEWIIVGGETPEGRITAVNALDLSNLIDLSWKSLPSLPVPLSNAHVFILEKKLHIAGGETGSITSALHYVLDLTDTSKGWQLLKDLPYPVSHGVMLYDNRNKRYLLLGGRAKVKDNPSIFYQSSLAFDISTNLWKEAEPLPFPLAAGTGITFNDGNMFIFGGDNGKIFQQVEQCLIEASNSKDSAIISFWNNKRKILQSGHPGFSREVITWNVTKKKWISTGSLPFPTPVTTQTVMNRDFLIIPGGEVKAGVRTSYFYIKKIKP